ncbi:hypothetical protein BDP27DRAFT_1452336, partial [Rhodocollybia butyracea]
MPEPEVYQAIRGIFKLTWICFWWRDEALSNSTFWSRIVIKDGPPPTTEVTAFLNECILRSGASMPLSIVISISLRQVALSVDFKQSHWIGSLFPSEPSSTHFP